MYDIRDNKPYTVRKLADGNCWMTDNLALELTAGTPVEASLNTSATAYTFTPTSCGTNGACVMNGNTLTPAPNGNYYYSWYAATAGTGTPALVSADASASVCPVGWKLPSNYTISSTKSFGSLTNSYRLTSDGATSSTNYTAELEASPLSFARSGYYYSGSLHDSGTIGLYWTATSFNSTNIAYDFYYSTSFTIPQYSNDGRYYSPNVRCVAL